VGGAGTDELRGGDGIDTADYSASAAAVAVNLLAGSTFGGDAQGDTLFNIENLIGTGSNDTLVGNASVNVIRAGADDDAIGAVGGNDTLDGGDGNDTVSYDFATAAANASLATDTDSLGNTLTSVENLIGSSLADQLTGDAAANILTGAGGDDILEGGAGADTLDGRDGSDTASFSASAAAVAVNLLQGTAGGGDAQGDTLTSIENLTGSAFNDTLVGDTAVNVLTGGAGGDLLAAVGGGDTLDGGDGNDTVSYDFDSVAVTASLATGADSRDNTLTGVENLIGSSLDDRLTGDAGVNILTGAAGNDILEGGAGADVLDGRDGIDTVSYAGSAAGVTVDLAAGTGSGGDAVGDTYAAVENLTGSAFADTLHGSAGANALAGGDGTDVLIGGAGADSLDGGAGIDTARYNTSGAAVTVDLAAGTGIGGDAQGDTLANIENLGGSAFNDTLSGNAGANLIGGGGGDDTLAGAAGNDTLLGGNGTDGLDGGDGWDTLEGEAGDDRLTGGAGGDILRGGAGADHLAGGADYDIASYWDSTVGVTINLETGVNTGGTAQGDTIADDVETINGSNHDDVMTGNALANALIGFDGNDTLTGGGGDDVLRGGAGADTLNAGNGGDVFSYTAVSDSTASAADTIQDFQSWDGISLKAIDADGNAANGDTAFSFIGTTAFSGTAGQLRYEIAGDTTTVSADVDGDSAADMIIHLTGAITLTASEFLL
jgi:Ca2+-binding RTX toxin-like protein